MKCNNCGNEFEESFCDKCGANDLETPESKIDKGKRSLGKKIGAVLIVISVLAVLFATFYFAFTTAVPDVVGVDEETAKNIIEQAGLIPAIKHDYVPNLDGYKILDDYVEEGLVFEVSPTYSTRVRTGSKVNISISKGPEVIEPKEGIISYPDILGIDLLKFMVNINRDNLRISLIPKLVNCKKFKWKLGYASIDEAFSNKIPVSIDVAAVRNSELTMLENCEVYAGEEHWVYIDIPLDLFDKRTLEKVYLDLTAEKDGVKQTVKASFDLSW